MSSSIPTPGQMLGLSASHMPAHLVGIVLVPGDPFQYEFLVHQGDSLLNNEQKQVEYTKLVKYFLAALTVPDADQWVNLSPYEHDRIIKDNFGRTEMGRDLLAQDYILKQITSSLMYPESGLGKKFWDKVYERARAEYGTTDIPVDTFNKIWIVPHEAEIYESGNVAYIARSRLKIMLEEDYLALAHQTNRVGGASPAQSDERVSPARTLASKVIKEVILPEIEREVNEGENFARLRQVYSAMILATWYKRALKQSLLNKIYADQGKVKGFDNDPRDNQRIYDLYLEAMQKGVYNFIREDFDEVTQEMIPRKYFAGGFQNNLEEVITARPVSSGVIDGAVSGIRGRIDRTGIVLRSLLTAGLLAAAALGAPGESLAGTATPMTDGAVSVESREDLLRQQSELQRQIADLEGQLSAGEFQPPRWQTSLGLQYHTLNDQPNYGLSLGARGPLGESGTLRLGLRLGEFSGDVKDIYRTLQKGQFAAVDASYQYTGSFQLRANFTGLRGTLDSRPAGLLSWVPSELGSVDMNMIDRSRMARQDITGAAFAVDAGKAFRIASDLVVSPYAGAHIWALTTGGISGAAANAGAYAGSLIDYEIAPGENIQLYAYRSAAISHLDYSSRNDSFGLVPNARDYGVRYNQENFSAELRRSSRLLNNETNASVVYETGAGQFSIRYADNKSRYDYLASKRTGSFQWSITLPWDQYKGWIVSLNAWASRNGSPYIENFNTRGVMATLSFQDRVRDTAVKFDFGRGYTWNNERVRYDVDRSRDIAARLGNNMYAKEFLLDFPLHARFVVDSPSLYGEDYYRWADSAVRLSNALSSARSFDDLAYSIAEGLNASVLTPAEKEERLLVMMSMIQGKLGANNIGESRHSVETNLNRIQEALQQGVWNNQAGYPIRIPVVGTGGAAQFVSTLTTRISDRLEGVNVDAFPTGVLVPGDQFGNFLNKGYTVLRTSQGIVYMGPDGRLFPTGTNDLMTSRRIYGAALGILQLYREVANAKGRHYGYARTPEGQIILGNLFPDQPEDMGKATLDFYLNTARIRANIGWTRDQLRQVTERLNSLPADAATAPPSAPAPSVTPAPSETGTAPAAAGSAPTVSPVGGIDMSGENLNLLIRKDPSGAALPWEHQDVTRLQGIEGFVPQIISITPLSAAPLLSR